MRRPSCPSPRPARTDARRRARPDDLLRHSHLHVSATRPGRHRPRQPRSVGLPLDATGGRPGARPRRRLDRAAPDRYDVEPAIARLRELETRWATRPPTGSPRQLADSHEERAGSTMTVTRQEPPSSRSSAREETDWHVVLRSAVDRGEPMHPAFTKRSPAAARPTSSRAQAAGLVAESAPEPRGPSWGERLAHLRPRCRESAPGRRGSSSRSSVKPPTTSSAARRPTRSVMRQRTGVWTDGRERAWRCDRRLSTKSDQSKWTRESCACGRETSERVRVDREAVMPGTDGASSEESRLPYSLWISRLALPSE